MIMKSMKNVFNLLGRFFSILILREEKEKNESIADFILLTLFSLRSNIDSERTAGDVNL